MNRWLFFVDIEPGASDPPLPQGLNQRLLMDNRTSSGVDQERCRFHSTKLVGADEMVSFRSQQGVNSQKIRFPKQRGLIDISGPKFVLNHSIDPLRVIVEQSHPDPPSPPGHGLTDPAEPENSQSFSVYIRSEQEQKLPFF